MTAEPSRRAKPDAHTPQRHLREASAENTLCDEIEHIAAQIDRRLGTPPGTSMRGICMWLWPPEDCSAEVLMALHTDAVGFLHRLITEGTL